MFDHDFDTIWTYIKNGDDHLSKQKYREIVGWKHLTKEHAAQAEKEALIPVAKEKAVENEMKEKVQEQLKQNIAKEAEKDLKKEAKKEVPHGIKPKPSGIISPVA